MNIDRIPAVIQAVPARPRGEGDAPRPAVGELLRLSLAAAQGDDLLLTDGAGFALRLQGLGRAAAELLPGDVVLLRVLSAGPRLELAFVGTAGRGTALGGLSAPGAEPPARPLFEQAAMRPDQSALRRIALQLPEPAALGEAWYLRALGGGRGPAWPQPAMPNPGGAGGTMAPPVLLPTPPGALLAPPLPAAATPPGGGMAAVAVGEPAAPLAAPAPGSAPVGVPRVRAVPAAGPASSSAAGAQPVAVGGVTRAEAGVLASPSAAHELAALSPAGEGAGRAALAVDRLAMPVFAWGGVPAELVLIATAEEAPPPARRRPVLVLRVALKLPLYGRIALQVRWAGGGVHLQLLAEREAALPALRQALPAIAAALAAAGMPLRKCTVHGGLAAEVETAAALPSPAELAARAQAMSPGPFRAAAEVVVVLLARALAAEHEAALGAGFGGEDGVDAPGL